MKAAQTIPINDLDIFNKKYKKSWKNSFPCSKQSRAVAVSEELQVFVSNSGKVYASRTKSLSNIWEAYDIKDRSLTVKFSLDQDILAIGCDDCCIYIFDVSPEKPDG